MATTAPLDLPVWRNDDIWEFPLRVVGPNLTGITMRGQVRLQPDTPGAPLVDLATVTTTNTQGIRLAGVTTDALGRFVNDVRIRLDKSTRQNLPYAGEMGDAAVLAWAFQIAGRTRITGRMPILAHTIDSDNAPLNRPAGYSILSAGPPSAGATLTIGEDDVAELVIDGADLIAAYAQQVSDAADAAEAAASNAAADAVVAVQAQLNDELAQAEGILASATAIGGTVNLGSVYATPEAGRIAVTDGTTYVVAPTASGATHYYAYRRVGTKSVFVGFVPVTVAGLELARTLQTIAAQPRGGQTRRWVFEAARAYDRRAIPNVLGVVPPTLSWLPDPLIPADEQGDTTPTRAFGQADPQGGTQATRLGFTAQIQPLQLITRADNPGMPTGDLREAVDIKQVTAGMNIALGAGANTAGQYTQLAVSTAWQTLLNSNAGFGPASAIDIGVRNAVGGGAGDVDIYAPRIVDQYQGSDLPTGAAIALEAAQHHAGAPVRFPGSLPISKGFLDPSLDANFRNLVIPFADEQVATAAGFTLGIHFDIKTDPAGTNGYGSAISVANQDNAASASNGQVGVYNFTSANPGRLYLQPALSSIVARCPQSFTNRGPMGVSFSLYPGSKLEVRVEGALIWRETINTQVVNATPFALRRILCGAYDGSKKRRQNANLLKNPFTEPLIEPKALTGAEHRQWSRNARRAMRLLQVEPAPKKVFMPSFGDSNNIFLTGWPWPFMQANLVGLVFAALANGGSFYLPGATNADNAYNTPDRTQMMLDTISDALRAGFSVVAPTVMSGTNDILASRYMDLTLSDADFLARRTTIDRFWLDNFKKVDDGTGRLFPILRSILPRGYNASTPNIDALQARIAFSNNDRLANYAAQGWKAFIYQTDVSMGSTGFASLQAAADAAVAGGASNYWWLSDGIHTNGTGAADIVTQRDVPFWSALLPNIETEFQP